MARQKPSCANTRKELKICYSLFGHKNRNILSLIRSQHSLQFLEMIWWKSVPRGSSAFALRAFSLEPTHLPWVSADASSSFCIVLFYIKICFEKHISIISAAGFFKKNIQTRQFARKFNQEPKYGAGLWSIGRESAKLNIVLSTI